MHFIHHVYTCVKSLDEKHTNGKDDDHDDDYDYDDHGDHGDHGDQPLLMVTIIMGWKKMLDSFQPVTVCPEHSYVREKINNTLSIYSILPLRVQYV